VIDENKTVIGNINTVEKEKTGGLMFRCDLCQMEVSSRQQLRAHKHSAHGVTPAPPSAVAELQCPLCERYVLASVVVMYMCRAMESNAILVLHMRVAHTGLVNEQLLHAYEAVDGKHKCTQCRRYASSSCPTSSCTCAASTRAPSASPSTSPRCTIGSSSGASRGDGTTSGWRARVDRRV